MVLFFVMFLQINYNKFWFIIFAIQLFLTCYLMPLSRKIVLNGVILTALLETYVQINCNKLGDGLLLVLLKLSDVYRMVDNLILMFAFPAKNA